MFLEVTIRRNPRLIRSAVELHQSGEFPHIPTYVIDIDAVKQNARVMSNEARRLNLSLYFMSKQFGRNPLVSKAIVKAGIEKAVAVESQDAKALHRYGIQVGHAGHLVQIPKFEIATILRMRPEVITVFNVEKARQISNVAQKMGITQKLLLRIQDIEKGDSEIPAEQGGFTEEDLLGSARAIKALDGVKISGVTTFPAASFNEDSCRVELTPNFHRIKKFASILRNEIGLEIEHLNAPWPTSTAMLKLLAENGATHGEPGHGLMGTTPWHIFSDLPEIPAWVYVTEVSHMFGKKAMVYGGGMGIGVDFPTFRFSCPKFMSKFKMHALIGSDPDLILNMKAQHEFYSPEFTDYYSMLNPDSSMKVESGDTVVYAFRPQIFVTRAQVAVVEGIQSDKPRVVGIFDRAGSMIDEAGNSVDDHRVLELMEKI